MVSSDSYILADDGLLLRYIPQVDDVNSSFRMFIPRSLRKDFIRYFHDTALAGHSSASKPYDKLCQFATWPAMCKDVVCHARSCLVCQQVKLRGGLPPGLMQPVLSKSPWQIVACDIMGHSRHTPRGNRYLLVVTDHLTKWVELIPLPVLTSHRIWNCLLNVFSQFGFPPQLITDNATYFTGHTFVKKCSALGIKHRNTSPYHQ